MMMILHSITSDSPDDQPWPPADRNPLWVIVRRTNGCMLGDQFRLSPIRCRRTTRVPRQQLTNLKA
jgi:hypothetical protein